MTKAAQKILNRDRERESEREREEGKLHCKYAQNDRSIKLKIVHVWTGAAMIEREREREGVGA